MLQSVPKQYDLDKIKSEILKIKGIKGLHDCHIWQLGNNDNIFTSHIECQENINFMNISDEIKKLLIGYQIHHSTIQPEYCEILCNHNNQENCCHDIIKKHN